MTTAETTSVNNPVRVTLQLPPEIYQQASKAADNEHRQVEDFLTQLVMKSLRVDKNYKLWQSVSDKYRSRLEREGKLDQTPEEILQELREVRERVTNELYPE